MPEAHIAAARKVVHLQLKPIIHIPIAMPPEQGQVMPMGPGGVRLSPKVTNGRREDIVLIGKGRLRELKRLKERLLLAEKVT